MPPEGIPYYISPIFLFSVSLFLSTIFFIYMNSDFFISLALSAFNLELIMMSKSSQGTLNLGLALQSFCLNILNS